MSLHVIRASKSHRRRIGAEAAVSNGLLNNLIAYWPGDEGSGNLVDAHTNGLDLTDINTVTSNPGHVYATARQYAAANSEYHSHADDVLLRAGDVDFTLASWVYLDSKPVGSMTIMAKFQFAPLALKQEYLLRYSGNVTDRFQFYISPDGLNPTTSVQADTFGALAIGTWYLVVASHDAANNRIRIQINNGVQDNTNHAAGVFAGVAQFNISGRNSNPNVADFWDGRIGPSAMWKSAAGGGGVLSAAARSALWNGGAGLPYASFTT